MAADPAACWVRALRIADRPKEHVTIFAAVRYVKVAPDDAFARGLAPVGLTLGRRRIGGRALLTTAVLLLAVGAALYESVGERSVSRAPVRSDGFSESNLLSLPLTAQGPVSAALGSESTAYRVSGSPSGFTASSPAQHLISSFSSSGVSVTSGATRVGLSLRGVGYGSWLSPVGQVAPEVGQNRVVYQRSGLSEWYVNGPLGLEQGFTVARAPGGRAVGPLTLAIALSGDTRAALARGGESISFSRGGKTAVRYAGLSATDASGRALYSWLALEGTRLLLHVDARGARYPLRIDPFIQQGGKLTGAGEIGVGRFGFSVALSSDGDTALVGGPDDNEYGAAWVFTRSGSTWTEQQKLGGSGVHAGWFGASVALSADGDTAVIGAPLENSDAGAAWIFTRSGPKWTEQQKVTGGGESGTGEFGYSVAVSSDGNTTLIGGRQDDNYVGAAWVFTRSGSTWSQQGAKLTGTGEVGGFARFGESVALSASGDTALIGGPADDNYVGGAWLFARSASTWSQQGPKLTGAGESGEAVFGYSVALSEDGGTAMIGGPLDNSYGGAAWAFTRSGSTWSQQGAKLTAGSGDELGHSVALAGNGNTALIGGSANEGVGAAWLFTRSGSTWSEQEKLTGSGETPGGGFGDSVALSSEGGIALVGGALDSEFGAAWVFVNAPNVQTGTASEVTRETATLNGTVNPNGSEITKCTIEYGTTESYGQNESCSPSPGSASTPVAVSAAVKGLTTNATYHFRVSATNVAGTSHSADHTFTTLETFKTGSTDKPAVPAEAEDKGLSVKATEGTGSVTVGAYGADIGGPPLARSGGAYFQVYHGEGASFKTIEYTDCELGGAKAIWWDDPATGWEPISAPTAVYSEVTHCITVTATESTTPSIAQLSDPRHVGGPAGKQEFGKCEPAKYGHFEDPGCTKEKYKEKEGARTYKGRYDWLAAPGGCYGQKKGRYADAACTEEKYSENKKTHERKYKGKYESGDNTFTTSGGRARLEASGLPTVECRASTSTGTLTDSKQGSETIKFTECRQPSQTECASEGASPGTIETKSLETYTFEESGYYTVLAGNPIAVFTCGSATYTLTGATAGSLTIPLNTMTTTGEAKFGEGKQELEVLDPEGVPHAATLSTTTAILETQATEFRATG